MALQQVGGTEQKSGVSRLTSEYLYWIITSDDDFSAATAEVAFLPNSADTKPEVGDWSVADIVANPDNSEQSAVRLLVGPNGKDLTPQTTGPVTYRVWIKIDTQSEQFVRSAGTLLVR
jgi:hypothetical protein